MIKIRGIIMGWINKNASGWLLLLTTLIYSLQSIWHDLPQDNTNTLDLLNTRKFFYVNTGASYTALIQD